jgi:hypothetical protein
MLLAVGQGCSPRENPFESIDIGAGLDGIAEIQLIRMLEMTAGTAV